MAASRGFRRKLKAARKLTKSCRNLSICQATPRQFSPLTDYLATGRYRSRSGTRESPGDQFERPLLVEADAPAVKVIAKKQPQTHTVQ